MKSVLQFSPTFAPGASGVGTLDFSEYSAFQLRNLSAVVNETRGTVIYAPAIGSAFGYTSFTSGVLTLEANTSTHSSGDVLQVIYEVTGPQSQDISTPVVQAGAKTQIVTFNAVSASSMAAVGMVQSYREASIGISQSAGSLVLTTGTTANASFLARSTWSVSGALSLRAKVALSQRIANQNFNLVLGDLIAENAPYIIQSATSILVYVNNFQGSVGQSINFSQTYIDSGGTPIPGRYVISQIASDAIYLTVSGFPASGTGGCTLFGWNQYQTLWSGAASTTATYDSAQEGWSNGATSATSSTSVSPGVYSGVTTDCKNAVFIDWPAASSGVLTPLSRAARGDRLPAESTQLYAFFWYFNGSTAPASSTTITLGQVIAEMFQNVPVYITGQKPQGDSFPLPGRMNVASINGGQVSSVLEQASTSGRAQVNASASPTTNNATEVTSATISVTNTGSSITQAAGSSMSAVVSITAISGSGTAMDVVLQESFDNGTTWEDVWHVERMTAVSTATIPLRTCQGRRRWISNVSGTSTSITRGITTSLGSGTVPHFYQFFDRTAGVLAGTLNATTSGYLIAGAKTLNARVTLGAATTPATYQIQVSDDKANWSSVGTATVAVASATTTLTASNVVSRYARVIVTSAGSGQTGTVVSITATN